MTHFQKYGGPGFTDTMVAGMMLGEEALALETKSENVVVKSGVNALNYITVPVGSILGLSFGITLGTTKAIYDSCRYVTGTESQTKVK
ncbi:hypothetical protein OAG24_00680 [bacterium]|nr:hypothetical protein [bacterium]